MKWINYTKYTPEDLGIDADDLMKALADYLLSSGFNNPYMQFSEFNEHTLDQLKEAIRRALEQGELFDPDRAEQMQQMLEGMSQEDIENLVQRLMQKLVDQGYIAPQSEQGS